MGPNPVAPYLLTRSINSRVFTREREKMQLEKEIAVNDGVMNKTAIRNYFQWINKGGKYESTQSTHVFLNRLTPSFSTCISLSKTCFLRKRYLRGKSLRS